ncbi:MAG: hypothetical protein B7Y41_08245 [Hydrogenophilales bacterium 28-61-23]|nr:MAG: hypothetical protein B7Y41_08245 [Hydrogenophilales bacterium 28-61-23]
MRSLARILIRLLTVCGLSAMACAAPAAQYRAGPDDYRSYLPRLVAGDRLSLRAGEYRHGLPLRDLAGEPGRPILIEGPGVGAGTGARARFIARPGANTVSLVDVRYLGIRNLELDGANLPVDAVKAEGHARYAHFVTLENLYIHDHAASQQNVAISTKCPAVGWVIRGNRIERVGTGMYLGNSDGGKPFIGGLIEANRVTRTLGYNVQIKHQNARPEGLPEANQAHTTVIKGNLFAKAESQPGPMARPNVLIGDMPSHGPGSEDRTLIYGNLFWHNPSESLLQGEGNLAVYNNVFVTQGPDAIRIQPHNGVPRDVRILRNTVIASGNGISVLTPEDNRYEQILAANAIFSPRPVSGGVQQGNLTGGLDRAGWFLNRPYAGLARIDLAPARGLGARPVLKFAGSELLPGLDADFLGHPRASDAVGAFERHDAGAMQAWLRAAGFDLGGL